MDSDSDRLRCVYSGAYYWSYASGKEFVAETVTRWTAIPTPQEIQELRSARTPEGFAAALNERNRWRADPDYRRRKIAQMMAEAKAVAMVTGTLACVFLWLISSTAAWLSNLLKRKRLRG